jgi:hypothetical protein
VWLRPGQRRADAAQPGGRDAQREPIDRGRCPRASRVDAAQSRTSASAACTGAAEASATRSWLSWLVISAHPWFSTPTTDQRGTRTDE